MTKGTKCNVFKDSKILPDVVVRRQGRMRKQDLKTTQKRLGRAKPAGEETKEVRPFSSEHNDRSHRTV